ncbi:MAG: bifunctional indole-3-glycerol phosphate synthase/phosphoribosylanthranilate isomerase, partial [Gemmatimonadetes bacterium]|nr:bifunctional indole-3-glycerol phosphate synthase/phosphoribosylanthranilate isomerase [Gemmatimonadota bacterium]
RDLATLEVDFSRFARLADRFPPGVTRVAESGLSEPGRAREVAALGYDAALVGSSLMQARDPEAAARAIVAAGRSAVVAHESVWVKICGLNSEAGVQAVGDSGADAAGFVFAESPRRVSPGQAAELAARLPPGVDRVAVFHHPSAGEIAEVLSAFPADIVQSEESVDVRRAVAAAGARLLPVLHDAPELERPANAIGIIGEGPAAILEAAGKGGQGRKPNWERAAVLARRVPLVLAGGLTPGNVAQAIVAVRPFGVDVSSGVEETRGRKDPVRIAAFVEAARAAALQPRGKTLDETHTGVDRA